MILLVDNYDSFVYNLARYLEELGQEVQVARNTDLQVPDILQRKLDAIVIESPPYFHPEQAAAGVEAGCHVYVAKPIAVDVPGCLQVQAAAKKAGEQKQCFLVDYQMPTDPHVLECAKRFRAGGLGLSGIARGDEGGPVIIPIPIIQDDVIGA